MYFLYPWDGLDCCAFFGSQNPPDKLDPASRTAPEVEFQEGAEGHGVLEPRHLEVPDDDLAEAAGMRAAGGGGWFAVAGFLN